MKWTKAVLVAAATSLVALGSARAADVPPMIPATAPPPPIAAPAQVFDWAGPYVGGFARLNRCFAICAVGYEYEFGARAGYNFVNGNLVMGASLDLTLWVHEALGAAFFTEANGRAGYLVTPRLLLYGKAGIGIWFAGDWFVTLGGGAEFAINDRLSIYAEASPNWYLPSPFGRIARYSIGVNFQLGD